MLEQLYLWKIINTQQINKIHTSGNPQDHYHVHNKWFHFYLKRMYWKYGFMIVPYNPVRVLVFYTRSEHSKMADTRFDVITNVTYLE
jgi:hypothetical protein